jgi:putative transposase
MSIRKVNFVDREYYHLYSRGNNKQKIFQNKHDYEHFLKLIFLANGEQRFKISFLDSVVYETKRGDSIVGIGAYCLMPNHFHILITQTTENGISKFMHKVLSSYSHYYNKRYDRTGFLFESKFKSEYVEDDIYLKYLFSYIHLNPVKLIQKDWKEEGIKDKIKVVSFLKDYKYSSFDDYLGFKRKENMILSREVFPEYFLTKKDFIEEIFDWLKIEL